MSWRTTWSIAYISIRFKPTKQTRNFCAEWYVFGCFRHQWRWHVWYVRQWFWGWWEDTPKRPERFWCKFKFTTGSEWNIRFNKAVWQSKIQFGRWKVSVQSQCLCIFNWKISSIFSFRTPLTSDNNASELRHRNRAARQEAMQDKIREIKRKQKETESKKISLPKKRRSLILSIVSGVLILSVVAYFYVKPWASIFQSLSIISGLAN